MENAQPAKIISQCGKLPLSALSAQCASLRALAPTAPTAPQLLRGGWTCTGDWFQNGPYASGLGRSQPSSKTWQQNGATIVKRGKGLLGWQVVDGPHGKRPQRSGLCWHALSRVGLYDARVKTYRANMMYLPPPCPR